MESFTYLNDTVVCGECETAPPTWDCKECGEHYCDSCKNLVHSKGQRKKHTELEEIQTCSDCSVHLAARKCNDCKGKIYCEKCFMSTHNRTEGKYRRHKNFEVFGVKQKPFVDPDQSNGFGIDVATLVCNEQRFGHWEADIEAITRDASEAAEANNADGETQHFTDVDILRMEGSVAQRRTRGWRRLNKLLVDDVYSEAQTATSASSPSRTTSMSVISAGSTRSRATSTSGASLVSIDALLNSKWHKERKSHYLFERPNNSLLQVSGENKGVVQKREYHGVTALSKFLDYEQLNDEEEESPETAAADTEGGKAFEVVLALLSMNGAALANTIVSAEHYREHGVLFTQLFDVSANQWRMLFVDDLFPCDGNGSLLFGMTEHSAETWKMFLLKSAAKFFGSMRHVEQSRDLVTTLRTVTGGVVTVDTWQQFRGDPIRGPSSQVNDRKLLKEYLWWYVQKACEHNCMLLLATTGDTEVEAAHAATLGHCSDYDEAVAESGEGDVLQSPIVAPCPLREALPDEVLPCSQLRKKAELLKKQQEVFYNTSLPDDNSPARMGEASPDMKELRKATDISNPTFDLANCGSPLFGAELTSRMANHLGIPRDSLVGEHALGLRLVKMHQFSSWVQQASMDASSSLLPPGSCDARSVATSITAGTAGQRFKYHNASRHWTKPLREYFDVTVADDDLTHATLEDMRSLFNSFVMCSDIAGGSRLLPISLYPTRVAPKVPAKVQLHGAQPEPVQSPIEGNTVKVLVKLVPGVAAVNFGSATSTSPHSSSATSGSPHSSSVSSCGWAAEVNFVSLDSFDLLSGAEVPKEAALDQVTINLFVPQPGVETTIGSLRRISAESPFASATTFSRHRPEDGGKEWLRIGPEGLPVAPPVSPTRGSAAGSQQQQQDGGNKVAPWLVLTVQAKYPRASLKVLLNFNKELVERVILLQETN